MFAGASADWAIDALDTPTWTKCWPVEGSTPSAGLPLVAAQVCACQRTMCACSGHWLTSRQLCFGVAANLISTCTRATKQRTRVRKVAVYTFAIGVTVAEAGIRQAFAVFARASEQLRGVFGVLHDAGAGLVHDAEQQTARAVFSVARLAVQRRCAFDVLRHASADLVQVSEVGAAVRAGIRAG